MGRAWLSLVVEVLHDDSPSSGAGERLLAAALEAEEPRGDASGPPALRIVS